MWKKSKDGGIDFDCGFTKSSNQQRYEKAKESAFSDSTTTTIVDYSEVNHKNYSISEIIGRIKNKK